MTPTLSFSFREFFDANIRNVVEERYRRHFRRCFPQPRFELQTRLFQNHMARAESTTMVLVGVREALGAKYQIAQIRLGKNSNGLSMVQCRMNLVREEI